MQREHKDRQPRLAGIPINYKAATTTRTLTTQTNAERVVGYYIVFAALPTTAVRYNIRRAVALPLAHQHTDSITTRPRESLSHCSSLCRRSRVRLIETRFLVSSRTAPSSLPLFKHHSGRAKGRQGSRNNNSESDAHLGRRLTYPRCCYQFTTARLAVPLRRELGRVGCTWHFLSRRGVKLEPARCEANCCK